MLWKSPPAVLDLAELPEESRFHDFPSEEAQADAPPVPFTIRAADGRIPVQPAAEQQTEPTRELPPVDERAVCDALDSLASAWRLEINVGPPFNVFRRQGR